MIGAMQDIALAYDQTAMRFDLVYNGTDIAFDTTAATPLLLALGTDRRAHPDDVLPDFSVDPLTPKSLMERRGWGGDALDTNGEFVGSRFWLLRRAKQSEHTRRAGEDYAAEAVATVAGRIGPSTLSVRWWQKGVLGVTVTQGAVTLMTIQQPVG